MARLEKLLDQTPEAAARMIALGALEEAGEGAARLKNEEDAEALHDFRVGLRRLRSFLRGYRSLLGEGIPKKQKKALKELAGRTTVARDTEVQLEWLEGQGEKLKAAHRPAWAWLIERLGARHRQAYAEVRGELLERFEELTPKLRRSLSHYTTELPEDRPKRLFAADAGELTRAAAAELGTALGTVSTATDVEEAHQARIGAKRLRYLLEPLRSTEQGETASALVKKLKGLQDLLGELHDAHVLAAEVANALVETATERVRRQHQALHGEAEAEEARPGRDLRPGLLGVDELLRDRIQGLFRELQAGWLAGRYEPFQEEIDAFAEALAAHGRRGVEIERKYLLKSLPPVDGKGEAWEIEQGWIPGESIRERLRKTEKGGESRFYRTIKSGAGIARLELEDETEREVFERLWPLTQGHRVVKRRYQIPDGERVWEIDQFLDRELFLAEVELPSVDAQVTLPGWLAPHVLREVTGEAEYTNEKLAK